MFTCCMFTCLLACLLHACVLNACRLPACCMSACYMCAGCTSAVRLRVMCMSVVSVVCLHAVCTCLRVFNMLWSACIVWSTSIGTVFWAIRQFQQQLPAPRAAAASLFGSLWLLSLILSLRGCKNDLPDWRFFPDQ